MHKHQGCWYKTELDSNPRLPADTDEAVWNLLFPHVQGLEESQRDIHVQNVLHSKLYTNREPLTFEWQSDIHARFKPINSNIENGIQSVVDTLEARIGTSRPKASIISRGATFGGYMQARRLDRFLWSEFVHHDIHPKMKRVFRDGCIYGTGFLKLDIDRGEIYAERVHPDEIVVDQRECISCDVPTTLYHRKLVSRLWLLETYGGKSEHIREKINDAQGKGFTYTQYRSPAEDLIVVIEAWKLPTRKGAGDGRHTICIENCTLVDQRYTRDKFPFVWFKWAEPDGGFYGRSLVADLVGYQLRQNELNRVQSLGMDLMSVPRIFADNGTRLSVEQLDNSVAKVIRHTGERPEAITWNAFGPEFYQERDRNIGNMFRFAGISELSSQSKLPTQARMDSSEAFREFSAIEDSRFNGKTQALEDAYKEVAEHLIELNKILNVKGTKVERVFHTRYMVDEIEWKDVDMERDRFVLEIGASSILNMSPAARKDTLREWFEAGLISPEEYKANSGNPDLERLSDQMAACYDYINWQAEQMMRGKQGINPDPLMNLPKGFNTMLDYYQQLMCLDDCPDTVIDMFVAWLENAKELMSPEPSEAEKMAAAQGLAAPGIMDPTMGAMGAGMPVQDPGLNAMAGLGPTPGMGLGMPGAPPMIQ